MDYHKWQNRFTPQVRSWLFNLLFLMAGLVGFRFIVLRKKNTFPSINAHNSTVNILPCFSAPHYRPTPPPPPWPALLLHTPRPISLSARMFTGVSVSLTLSYIVSKWLFCCFLNLLSSMFQFISFGMLINGLIALGSLCYMFKGSFGKANLNFNSRLSGHLLVNIILMFLWGFVNFGYPDASLVSVVRDIEYFEVQCKFNCL